MRDARRCLVCGVGRQTAKPESETAAKSKSGEILPDEHGAIRTRHTKRIMDAKIERKLESAASVLVRCRCGILPKLKNLWIIGAPMIDKPLHPRGRYLEEVLLSCET